MRSTMTVEERQALDRPALQQRRDRGVATLDVLERSEHELADERSFFRNPLRDVHRLIQRLGGRVVTDFDVVERLQRELARVAPRHGDVIASDPRRTLRA